MRFAALNVARANLVVVGEACDRLLADRHQPGGAVPALSFVHRLRIPLHDLAVVHTLAASPAHALTNADIAGTYQGTSVATLPTGQKVTADVDHHPQKGRQRKGHRHRERPDQHEQGPVSVRQ